MFSINKSVVLTHDEDNCMTIIITTKKDKTIYAEYMKIMHSGKERSINNGT